MITKDTEINQNGVFRAGPELLQATADHCMIRLNKTHSILTGGWMVNLLNLF